MDKVRDKMDQIKVVSFDIFDTLIFRAVRKPSDVFEIVWEKAIEKGYVEEWCKPGDFKAVRMKIEADLYKEQHTMYLSDIYNHFPKVFGEVQALEQVELDVECEVCYANPEMQDYMFECKKSGKKIILTSDMYLNRKSMEAILQVVNIDLALIDNIYISSEYGVTKQEGELFDVILGDYGITPDELCHIGDNLISDIRNADVRGIRTIYYPVRDNMNQSLFMEKHLYGNIMPELYSLRKYTTYQIEQEAPDAQRKWWMTYGAIVLGPFYAGAIEWVLDILKERNIHRLFLMMREGETFLELLSNALQFRDQELELKLVYASRNSLYLGGLAQVEGDSIQQILRDLTKETVNVKGVFELLDIMDVFPDELEHCQDVLLRNMDKETEQKIIDIIDCENVIKRINENREQQLKQSRKYFANIGMLEGEAATLDFGYKGTAQRAIERICQKQNCNLLILGKTPIDNIKDGFYTYGYVGTCGHEEEYMSKVLGAGILLECMLLRETGCTVGYDISGQPIMSDPPVFDFDQFDKVVFMHEGIKLYQKNYLEASKNNCRIREVKDRPLDLFRILGRSTLFPTKEEAMQLSSLQSEENFGNNYIAKRSIEDQNESTYSGDMIIEWESGREVVNDPLMFVKYAVCLKGDLQDRQLLFSVESAVGVEDEFVIVGAGEAGKRVYSYSMLAGLHIFAFTDNSNKKQGTFMYGIPVMSLNQVKGIKHFIIASIKYKKDLIKQVRDLFGENITIY